MLDANGNTDSVNVVNILGKGDVTDYGEYSSVKMLTSTTPISQNGNEITFTSDSDKIYYQGTMENVEIPWKIEITYQLDGKNVTADELAGASGALEIHLKITQNTLCDNNFFDFYALQTALTLDTNNCKNIVADGATLANVGADKQISYTVLPGQGLDAVISADVTDFESNIVTLLTGSNAAFLSLSQQLSGLVVNMSTLKTGIDSLVTNYETLDSGIEEYTDGVATIVANYSQLVEGVGTLATGSFHFYFSEF